MNFREFLEEALSDEYVMQALASKDINSKVEKNVVYVDKTDVQEAKKILKQIRCTMAVKEM